jgi:hypothetical protein
MLGRSRSNFQTNCGLMDLKRASSRFISASWILRAVDGQSYGHLKTLPLISALCVERPFLTSDIMKLRVPQFRRLALCIYRVRTTHKCLAICEGLGHPRPLIFGRVICATHAKSPSARSIGFCVIWVCISSSYSSPNEIMHRDAGRWNATSKRIGAVRRKTL